MILRGWVGGARGGWVRGARGVVGVGVCRWGRARVGARRGVQVWAGGAVGVVVDDSWKYSTVIGCRRKWGKIDVEVG